MLPWWPRALVEPLRHPLQTLLVLSRFPWRGTLLFEGQMVRATELPRWYLLEWFSIRLPEFVLLGLALGLGLFVHRVMTGRHRREAWTGAPPERRIGAVVVVFAALFPPFWGFVTHPVLYDGLRHFLFAVPMLVALAAMAYAAVLRDSRRWLRASLATLMALFLAGTLIEMIVLHPYEYIYFNRVVAGGLPKASKREQVDYWGAADKAGAEWIAANYAPRPGDEPLRVANCNESASVEEYLPRGSFVWVSLEGSPDLFLGARRSACWDRATGTVTHTIEPEGVRLLEVKEVSARAVASRLPSPGS